MGTVTWTGFRFLRSGQVSACQLRMVSAITAARKTVTVAPQRWAAASRASVGITPVVRCRKPSA